MKKNYDVVVIGGGANGLTFANRMAQKNKSVLVVEKAQQLGGLAARREFTKGYFSNGILQDTSLVSRDTLKGLGLEKFGVIWNTSLPHFVMPILGKSGMAVNFDPELTAKELLKFSEKDSSNYKEFSKFIQRVTGPLSSFLDTIPTHFENMSFKEKMHLLKTSISLRLLGEKEMLNLLRIPPMSVSDWLDEWFENEQLKAGLALVGVSCTSAGPRSPGTALNLLLKLVQQQNGIKNGPASLVQALFRSAETLGVEFICSTEVTNIKIQNKKVIGVELSNGSFIESPFVASSCDPKTTFLKLSNAKSLPSSLREQIINYRCKGATGVVNLALNSKLKLKQKRDYEFEYAKFVESVDALEKAFDCSKYGLMSDHPALELYDSGWSNENNCPEGHSTVSILVHYVPYLTDGNDSLRKELLERTLKVLEPHVENLNIVGSEALTPLDIENSFGLTGGHLTHGEHSLDQIIVRPVADCARYETPIEGLILCGSGSFPGGHLTCKPGHLASQLKM